mmetsp:Transcript_79253/g.256554  ORF Transcript_79253/g.256554 Transcript_79253/m.256554 type:complete len:236 (+) Transcript_79253:309-1016(+)
MQVPLGRLLVPLEEDQQAVPIGVGHHVKRGLEGGHDGHGEQHAGGSPDPAEEGHEEEDHNRMHLHVVLALHELHLDDVAKDEFEAQLPGEGNYHFEQWASQPAVEEDHWHWQQHGKEGTDLRHKVEEEGDDAEDGGEVYPQGMQQAPDAQGIGSAREALKHDVLLEKHGDGIAHVHRLAEPEDHVEEHHDDLHQQPSGLLHHVCEEEVHHLLHGFQGLARCPVQNKLGDPVLDFV